MSDNGMTPQNHHLDTANPNPPAVIRGLDSQKALAGGPSASPGAVGVHWLRGSVDMDCLAGLRDYCKLWFGDECQERLYGLWFYDRSIRWPNGVQLNFHSHSDRAAITRNRIALEIPGGALEVWGSDLVLAFMRGLEPFGFQCSRLDVYYDDVTRLVTPSQLAGLVHLEGPDGEPVKHDFTGFRRIMRRTISNDQGRTYDEVAFGARGSNGGGKYLRIYDKRLESKGENDAVRYELELSDERSQKAFEMLTHAAGRDAPGLIGALIGGCIDFKIRTGDKNLNRLERYTFWQKIVDRLSRVTLAGKRVRKSVERTDEWVRKQVAGALQMLRKAYGAEKFFPMLVDIVDGENRLRTQHYAALVEYERAIKGEPDLNIAAIRSYCDNVGLQLESDAQCS